MMMLLVVGASGYTTSAVAQSYSLTNPTLGKSGVTSTFTIGSSTAPLATRSVGAGSYAPQTTTVSGVVCDVVGSIIPGASVSIKDGARVLTGSDGSFQIAQVAPGQRMVLASRNGFRSENRTATIQGTQYTLDFRGDNGLVPNAPNISYVLRCINLWQSRPPRLGLSKILAVVHAWKFPV